MTYIEGLTNAILQPGLWRHLSAKPWAHITGICTLEEVLQGLRAKT